MKDHEIKQTQGDLAALSEFADDGGIDAFADWLSEVEVKDTRVLVDPTSTEEAPTAAVQVNGRWTPAKWNKENPALHICHACRGTGLWSPPVYATRGRTGKCHKCQGRGHFKASAAERAQQREYRKLTTATKLQGAKDEILADHADLIKWLEANKNWNSFARDLLDGEWGFNKRGKLSEKQIAAAQKMMDKMLAKEAEKQAAKEKAEGDARQAAPEGRVDLNHIPSGYYAVPNGETRLKVRVNRPGANSNWQGWTFVSDGAAYGQSQRYGRQAPGKLYDGKIVEQLKIIAADPREASLAYGKLVGVCGVCGRKLEDENSVAAGIGPVCASKMGW